MPTACTPSKCLSRFLRALYIYIYVCVCVIDQTASVQQFGLSGSGTDCDLLQKSVWQWILRRERKQWQFDALRWLLILYRFQTSLFAFSPSTPIPAVCQKFIQFVIPPTPYPHPQHTHMHILMGVFALLISALYLWVWLWWIFKWMKWPS